MYPKLSDDRDRLPELLAKVSVFAASVLDSLGSGAVATPPRERAPSLLPTTGLGAEAAFEQFRSVIAPSISASAGPRHLGFVTGGTTPAALIGDWVAALLDQNPVSRTPRFDRR